jgi:hypothetical protein
MDLQPFWNTLLAGGMAAMGWVLRSIYTAIKALENDLIGHKLEAAKTYSTKSDIYKIEEKLDRILDKLDRKVDR